MKHRFLPFFIMILTLFPIPALAYDFPTHVYPLTGNMTMTPYSFPKCGKALYLGSHPLVGKVNETHYAGIDGWVFVNCPDVKNASIVLNNVYNTTRLTYDFERDEYINVTLTVINVSVKLHHQEYRPIELITPDAEVRYSPYNSTHELVTFSFRNLRLSDFPIYKYAYGSLDPEDYGWPVNITIKILIDKGTGEGYLLDNGTLRYIGITPFWHPAVRSDYFVREVLTNTKLLIQEIKKNPWVVEQTLAKARMTDNITEANRLINQLAANLTSKIFTTEFSYLGRKVYLISDFFNLSQYRVTFEGVNITPNRFYYLPTFMMPIEDIYLVPTKLPHLSRPSTIDGIPFNNYTDGVMRKFLKTKDPSVIQNFIWKVLSVNDDYVPFLEDSWGSKWVVMDSTLPLDINKTYLFVLPLPEKYAKAFNSPYLLVEMGTGNAFRVKYDPAFFTPKDIITGWEKLGRCNEFIQTATFNRFLRILSDAKANGLNITAFEDTYPFIKEKLEMCGFNESKETSNTSFKGTSTILTNSSEKNGTATGSRTDKGGLHICGPALILGLSIIPLLRGLKKK